MIKLILEKNNSISEKIDNIKKELFKLIKEKNKNLKIAFETNTIKNGVVYLYIQKIDNLFTDYDEYKKRYEKQFGNIIFKFLLNQDEFTEKVENGKYDILKNMTSEGIEKDIFLSDKTKEILKPIVQYMNNSKNSDIHFGIYIGIEKLSKPVDGNYR